MGFTFKKKTSAFTFFTLFFSFFIGITVLSLFQNCGRFENLPPHTSHPKDDVPLLPSRIVGDEDIDCLQPNDQILPLSQHLKYVGMLSSMKNDTINFDIWKNDVNATLKMGNLQAVEFVVLKDDPQLNKSMDLFKRKMEYLVPFNLNLVLIIEKLFFDSNGQLYNNFSARWSQIFNIILPYRSSIKAIYTFDEPFWNTTWSQQKKNPVYATEPVMYNNLITTGQLVKKSLPEIPLVFIEGYPVINDKLRIPEIFDWVGMDCYTGFENCEGRSIPDYYKILKSKIKPGKKLVVLPPAMIFKDSSNISVADRNKVTEIFIKYMNWISGEPDIITSFSFLYAYREKDEVMSGANHICESADVHRLLWRKFHRMTKQGYIKPTYSCKGWGPLNSYSMEGTLSVANFDVQVPGHYFIGGFNVNNNSWYLYSNGEFHLYDGTDATVYSIPVNALNETVTAPLFTNMDLSSAPNSHIYIGYGVGITKLQAWNNMLTNLTYAKCATLPAN